MLWNTWQIQMHINHPVRGTFSGSQRDMEHVRYEKADLVFAFPDPDRTRVGSEVPTFFQMIGKVNYRRRPCDVAQITGRSIKLEGVAADGGAKGQITRIMTKEKRKRIWQVPG